MTRKVMKEVTEKREVHLTLFQKKLIINKVEITNTKIIAGKFNIFFVTIGPNLVSKIPKSDTNFEDYISKTNTTLHENPLTGNKILEVFKSLKINKVQGFDEINVNVINQIYNFLLGFLLIQ